MINSHLNFKCIVCERTEGVLEFKKTVYHLIRFYKNEEIELSIF